MNASDAIVQMHHVSKRFGKIQAMDAVDLEVHPGGIVGLLGSNGSGKSTLLRHAIGLYLPDEGQCVTFGCEAGELGPEQLARIGYVHQEGELLEWMTAGQLVRYVAAYYPQWDEDLEKRYVHDFEIDTRARVSTLSPGERQRLAILLAIGHNPQLLILDEPAAALDPIARSQFLDLLLQIIQDSERAVIISSHILSDVEKVIDRALILKAGRILRDCSFDALREEFCRVRLSALDGPLPEELALPGMVDCRRDGGEALVTVQNGSHAELQAAAAAMNCQIEIEPLSLEEIYGIVVS